MSKPLITVFIPLIQKNPFLVQALQSLSEQTYQNMELFFLSNDEEMDKAYLKSFFPKIEKLSFIQSSQNEIREVLNESLQLAQGAYITFLFPYDYYHSERLERCLERLQEEEAEFLFTKVRPVDEQNKLLSFQDTFWRWKQLVEFQMDSMPTVGFKLLQDNPIITLGNAFFSKRIITELKAFRCFKTHYAYDFFLRALQLVEPIFFKEELFFLRIFKKWSRFTEGSEAVEIRTKYLLETNNPCKNKLAPSHLNWPMSFSSFRLSAELDKGFAKILNEKKIEDVSPVSIKSLSGEKISIVAPGLDFNEESKIAIDLALSLQQRGYSPLFISLEDGPLKEKLTCAQIPVKILNKRIWKWQCKGNIYKKMCAILLLTCQFFFLVKKRNIAVGAATWPLVLIGATFFPLRKSIWYLHEPYPPEAVLTEGVPMKLLKKCLNKTNLSFWFGSQTSKKIWEKAGSFGKLFYWSGLQPEPEPKKIVKIKKLLSVSGQYARQGAYFLLEAFLKCISEELIPQDVTLTIAGFSDKLEDLQQFGSDLITKCENPLLKERVFLHKSLDQNSLAQLFVESDLLIQPALLESSFINLFHAQAMGIPIVTTESELIQDGVNGFVCPKESIEKLAFKIAEAINHPEESARIAKNAWQEFKEHYSLEATESRILSEVKEAFFQQKKFKLLHKEIPC